MLVGLVRRPPGWSSQMSVIVRLGLSKAAVGAAGGQLGRDQVNGLRDQQTESECGGCLQGGRRVEVCLGTVKSPGLDTRILGGHESASRPQTPVSEF